MNLQVLECTVLERFLKIGVLRQEKESHLPYNSEMDKSGQVGSYVLPTTVQNVRRIRNV